MAAFKQMGSVRKLFNPDLTIRFTLVVLPVLYSMAVISMLLGGVGLIVVAFFTYWVYGIVAVVVVPPTVVVGILIARVVCELLAALELTVERVANMSDDFDDIHEIIPRFSFSLPKLISRVLPKDEKK